MKLTPRTSLALATVLLLGSGLILSQPSAVFPSSVVTWGDLLCASNTSNTFLTVSMDGTQTTATVADATSFSSCSTGFVLVVESEIVRCASRSGNVFSGCSRGYNGSTATSHSVNSPARGLLTAAHHNNLAAEIQAVQQRLGQGFPSAGLQARSGAALVGRTLTGTAGRITVSNADGSAGNPTVDVGSDVALKSDSSGIPTGTIVFSTSASCAPGFSEYAALRGRYVLGRPSGGLLEGTQGEALTDRENRAVGTHTHNVNDPGHSHGVGTTVGFSGDGVTSSPSRSTPDSVSTASSSSGVSVLAAGAVAGTPAPYIQLTPCRKN
jgi:hypothetical protein